MGALQSKVAVGEESLAESEASREEIQRQLGDQQTRTSEALEQVHSLQEEVAASRAAVDEAESANATAAAEVERLRARADDIEALLPENGRVSLGAVAVDVVVGEGLGGAVVRTSV